MGLDLAEAALLHGRILHGVVKFYRSTLKKDGLGWGLAESEMIRGFDPVEGMREVF